MRILWSWLKELVSLSESPEAVAERLTRAGLEVESIEPYHRLPEALQRIYVGEIIAQEKHPNADKLLICTVRLSPETHATIVTGATNTYVGAKVPVALPGSQVRLQGRWTTLEARPFRGILSEGMLCSEVELGLGPDADGIYLLPPETPIGAPLTQVLEDYSDIVLEISVTPNRGDALSHLGIAREYAALTEAKLHVPTPHVIGERFPFPLQLKVPDTQACPRYGGIYVRGLTGLSQSPPWLRYRLEAAGLRAIHPIVDVTNYILLGFGQPLHAFDAKKLIGNTLIIAPLSAPTSFDTLQGETLALAPGDLVIADAEGPACLAGLIGGKRTGVSATTSTVFIESAYFSPADIRRTGRRLRLHTESGYRFMRGTDPQRVPWAAEMAASLLQQLYPSAEVSLYAEKHDPAHTAPYRFTFSLAHLRAITGLPLPPEATQKRLEALDITITPETEDRWQVTVPRYRLDVTRPADIAEELLRLEGWDALPQKPPAPLGSYPHPSPTDIQYLLRENLSEFLTGMGLMEIRTNSLVGAHHFPPDLGVTPLRLANPLYEELAYLRPTLIGSGLEVLLHNRNHGAQSFWAYEWGRIYHQDGEEERLTLWGWGRPPAWEVGRLGPAPYAYLAGVVRALLQRARVPFHEKPFTTPTGPWLYGLHLHAGETYLGTVGLLRPEYLKRFRLAQETIASAELVPLFLHTPPRLLPTFTGLSYHPVVVKDLSVFVPDDLPYTTLVEALQNLQYPYLQKIEPFDHFRHEGQKSYGLRLYLQADHTLTDAEIHTFLAEAIQAIEKTGAQVRKA
ncbi:MAG: phenylalanine--tRNA ligase subunit beta [Bacteroidia bacterium]|nr:phenylalanine--tRNA ligase subunit beta [Bacteroidia bacterium]GIV24115.1 MAG: phenylalanine--tRNA ligase beta subunit [Bacteroidia bacterium]